MRRLASRLPSSPASQIMARNTRSSICELATWHWEDRPLSRQKFAKKHMKICPRQRTPALPGGVHRTKATPVMPTMPALIGAIQKITALSQVSPATRQSTVLVNTSCSLSRNSNNARQTGGTTFHATQAPCDPGLLAVSDHALEAMLRCMRLVTRGRTCCHGLR